MNLEVLEMVLDGWKYKDIEVTNLQKNITHACIGVRIQACVIR